MRGLLCGLGLLASVSCLRTTQFKCETSDQCGTGGVCQTNGFCSIPDSSCTGGQRYADSAGASSGTCVGATLSDGAVDSPRVIDSPLPTDGPAADGPANDCPSGYNLLPGITGHRYKTLTTADQWVNQLAACASGSAGAHPFTYLAIPDDAAEIAALDGSASGGSYWVGIESGSGSDFITSTGAPATFLQWAPGQPAGTGCANMAAGGPMAGKMNLEKCSSPSAKHTAICECEP